MKAEFQVTYFLWKSRKNAEGSPVYIRSKQNSAKQISYYTGIRIQSDQWNKSKNEPKNKPGKLIELETKLKNTYRDLAAQGHEPNLNDLLSHLNDVKKPTNKNIVAWCDDFLRSPYSEGQKKAVKTLRFNLAGDKDATGYNKNLTFDQLSKPKLKAFFEYLTERGVANNSQYKRLRALINVADHANLNLPELKSYSLPYSTVNSLQPRLTWQEVKSVMNTEAKTKVEQIAKDVFLLACFSGLRIEDLLTLNQGELHQFYYERVQQKTKYPVYVTVHKYNESLIKKYISEGVGYSRQSLSRELKPLLRRAGLTKEVKVIKTVGFQHKETVKPKNDLIAFHSGRRFYARLLNDLGLGGEIARDELGHSFKSVTELYAGSPEHSYRVARVRKAMETLEKTLEELALMKVA